MRIPARRSLRKSRSWWAAAVLVATATLLLALFVAQRLVHRRVHDLLIRDVAIVDGSGAPPYRGSIAIDGDRITAIYPETLLLLATGRTMLSGKGLHAAPGFIDTHTHADQNILSTSGPVRANNFVGQGVTTIITGNCGRSPVDVRRFRDLLAVRGTNVNVATLAGLNSIRAEVMKSSTLPATTEEIRKMSALVAAAMRNGALGVSTGAAYVPGRFASEAETFAQIAVAARHGGIFATHLRDEGTEILPAVDEALRHSVRARIPLLISHFKIAGPANCGKYLAVDRRIAAATARGVKVYADQYPYTASSSSLDLYLPDWFLGARGAARRAFLDTAAGRTRLTSYLQQRIAAEGFRDFAFARVASYEHNVTFAGSSIRDIARAQTHATEDAQIGVILEILRHGGAQMVYHNICADPALQIARRPTTMFGSDSAIRDAGGAYKPHPRGWGTFPRVLAHLVRQQQLLPVEEAVRRMTALPASVLGLDRRGRLKEGWYADVVLFDAGTIADRATYDDPFRPPRGIAHVIVNGKLAATTSTSPAKRERDVVDILPHLAGRFLTRNDKGSLHPKHSPLRHERQ